MARCVRTPSRLWPATAGACPAKPRAAIPPDRSGKPAAHRLDQPGIAIDQQRRVAVVAPDVIDRQRAVPAELLSDRRHRRTQLGTAHALLDRLAAADACGDLPIAVKPDQAAMAKHRLRLFGCARDEILHHHLVGERPARAEFPQRGVEITVVAHEPHTAARGADRGFDDRRKPDPFAEFGCRGDDPRGRLRQAQLVEQPAEAGLAMHGAVACKGWQRQPGVAFQPLPHAREQKSLLMGRQQHVETPRRPAIARRTERIRPDRPASPDSDEIYGQTARTAPGNSGSDRRPRHGGPPAPGS